MKMKKLGLLFMMLCMVFAKTMTGRSKMQTPVTSTPQFQTEAIQNALDMSQFSAEELERLLRVNSKIAAENYMRFQDFCIASVWNCGVLVTGVCILLRPVIVLAHEIKVIIG